MYFLYTLLQSLNHGADLNDPDSIDELRVICVEMATQMVMADSAPSMRGPDVSESSRMLVTSANDIRDVAIARQIFIE